MIERLHDWEIQTIEALAYEALDKASRNEFVRFPDRFRETFTADLQRDALEQRSVRTNVARQADRMGIGVQHPPHISSLAAGDEYEVATKETASRWARIIKLVLTVDEFHEWRQLHAELVTGPLMAARKNDEKGVWDVPDEGFGILEILEIEAERHGLIEGPAPVVDPAQLARELAISLANRKPTRRTT